MPPLGFQPLDFRTQGGGHIIVVPFRHAAEGRAERAREIAAEFVQLRVDVIMTAGTVDVLAAKQATTSTPIVFAAAGDPVGAGLVESLSRPGSSVTGLSLQVIDTAGKRLSLLREILPGLHYWG